MSAVTDSKRLHLHAEETVVAAEQQLQDSRSHLAGYLGHVALECYLKAWILVPFGGCQEKFKSAHPVPYRKYFGSSDGHDLSKLITDAAIARKISSVGTANPCSGAVWARMTHGARPYSLRYREEAVSKPKVQEELTLMKSVMKSLGRLP